MIDQMHTHLDVGLAAHALLNLCAHKCSVSTPPVVTVCRDGPQEVAVPGGMDAGPGHWLPKLAGVNLGEDGGGKQQAVGT